ncbi:uncharacterized protein LOC109831154 [Asparagus officinalis]|uniref:uncharacterized protein LOC109831154 n=1 Tax=Asparagus officinalis TaxID=4686 RepID=UPI00098E3FFB|nr:uncharacterized protein LOC109831154 [Asparagus officinalis]
MAKKKRNNGKKLFNIGLRASNSGLISPIDQSDTGFMKDDEDFNLEVEVIGSTGPKGEKKKKLMVDILSLAAPQVQIYPQKSGVQMRIINKAPFSQSGAVCSPRISWADEVDLDVDSSPHHRTSNLHIKGT